MQPEFHNIFAAGEGSSEAESERGAGRTASSLYAASCPSEELHSESAPVRTSEHPDAAANADMQMQVSYIWRLWWDLPTNESIIISVHAYFLLLDVDTLVVAG